MNVMELRNLALEEERSNRKLAKRKKYGKPTTLTYSTKYIKLLKAVRNLPYEISSRKLCELMNEKQPYANWQLYIIDNNTDKCYVLHFNDRTHDFDVLHADYSNESKEVVLEKLSKYNWFKGYLSAKVDKDDNVFYQYYYTKSNNKSWHEESKWTGIARLPRQLKTALESYLEQTFVTKDGLKNQIQSKEK